MNLKQTKDLLSVTQDFLTNKSSKDNKIRSKIMIISNRMSKEKRFGTPRKNSKNKKYKNFKAHIY